MTAPATTNPNTDAQTMQDVQRAHYDRIMADYEAHYDDPTSQRYRDRFLYDPMFKGVEIEGRQVLEAMCGSGQCTRYLLNKGANVTGLDLADVAVDSFRERWPECEGIEASILETGLPDASFDCVAIIGGLHHVHPYVNEAIAEVHRVLKPGGAFLFGEPHVGSFFDTLRRWWYRRDSMFEEGEEAVDIRKIQCENSHLFDVELEKYVGSVAYLLVFNSLIFRVPTWSKPYYAPPLFLLERMLGVFHTRRTTCFALNRWRKRC